MKDKLQRLVVRIEKLEKVIVDVSDIRGTIHICDVDKWNALRDCADAIKKRVKRNRRISDEMS